MAPRVADVAKWTPIPTDWNGYKFRSRIEARWACFLDSLEVPYRYETEGIHLDALGDEVNYLPDFWLPEQQAWFEVKGETPTANEHYKASLLAIATHHPTYIAWGDVWRGVGPYTGILVWYDDGLSDPFQMWAECRCGKFAITSHGLRSLPCHPHKRGDWPGFGCSTPRLERAYRHARQQRFGT